MHSWFMRGRPAVGKSTHYAERGVYVKSDVATAAFSGRAHRQGARTRDECRLSAHGSEFPSNTLNSKQSGLEVMCYAGSNFSRRIVRREARLSRTEPENI